MAKHKRPEAKTPAAKTGTAGQSRTGGAPKPTKKTAAPKATSKKNPAAKLTPFDPEYERPISELPPLVFPNSEQYEFRLMAEERRRTRLRNETIFGAVLGVIGVIVLVAAHTPGFLGLAAIAAVAMAAYELMVSGLE